MAVPSGLKDYDVQFKDGIGGAWTDWQMATTETSASYTGIGGHTYYFRARARDNAGNIENWPSDFDSSTRVKSIPPKTQVDAMLTYSRSPLVIRWGGTDPGGSGIQTYDIQYREAGSGVWNYWLLGTTDTSSVFTGTPGSTYSFRSRATDYAQNIEDWPSGDGNTLTTLYTWGANGTIRDNTGVPVTQAKLETTPAAFLTMPGDSTGNFAAYWADTTSVYTLTWQKDGYGSLPPTGYVGGSTRS